MTMTAAQHSCCIQDELYEALIVISPAVCFVTRFTFEFCLTATKSGRSLHRAEFGLG